MIGKRRNTVSGALRLIVTYGVSALLLFRITRSADLKSIVSGVVNADTSDYTVAVLLYLAAQLTSASKWRLFISNSRFINLFRWAVISQFFLTVIPGQVAGDFMRAYGVSKGGVQSSESAACAILDRATGLIGMMILVVIAIQISSIDNIPHYLKVSSVIVLSLSVLFFCLSVVLGRRFRGLADHAGKGMFSRLLNFTGRTALALNASGRDIPKVLFSILLSMLFHLLFAGMISVLAGSAVPGVSFLDWCWIGGMISIISLFPLSVGGLGVREGGFSALLALFGVAVESAVILSLTLFSIQLIGASAGALLFFIESHRMKPQRDESKTSVCINDP
ncbi:MAG: lysylphosphatidylglycerol synthase transmembrane domain-containing protein [Chitinispirillaceae bacterium]